METETIYKIRSFESDRDTNKEIELRREFEANFENRLKSYTTKRELDALKNFRASCRSFHPSNHLYVYDGDLLLGFTKIWPSYNCNNEVTGNSAITMTPIVRNQNKLIGELLFNKTIEKAEQMGLKSLKVIIDSGNLELLKEADRYDFRYEDMLLLQSSLPITELQTKVHLVEGIEIKDFDKNIHSDAVVQAYEAAYFDNKTIQNQMKWLENIEDKILSWKVALEGEKLIGHSIVFKLKDDDKVAQLNVVTRGLNITDIQYDKAIKSIYSSHIPYLKSNGVEFVELNIHSAVLEYRPIYESYGFEFYQRDYYTYRI